MRDILFPVGQPYAGPGVQPSMRFDVVVHERDHPKANGTELVCNFRGLKLLAFPNSGHFVENSLDGHSLQFG